MVRNNGRRGFPTYLLVMLAGVLVLGFGTPVRAEWESAVGTGISITSVKGEMGAGTALFGPVSTRVDLSPSEYNDLVNSSFAIDVSLSDGTWRVEILARRLGFREDADRALTDGTTVSSDMDFVTTSAEITVGHPVYRSPAIVLGVLTGMRYDRHKLSVTLARGAAFQRKNSDKTWVDALIGVTADIPLAEKWTWNNTVRAGFGGSDGTTVLTTGVTWRFHPRWSTELYGHHTAATYENASRGDEAWYLYDMDETVWGVNVLFHF